MTSLPPRHVPVSAPIPIASKRPAQGRGGAKGASAGFVSASVPNAPVFGSLKAPTMMLDIPDLSLPPPSPEAFSLSLMPVEPEQQVKSRMVGVSSAPARTFIDQAKRGPTPGLGVSPTVLSVLQQRGADDMLTLKAGNHPASSMLNPPAGADSFAKLLVASHGKATAVAAPEGGLAAALRNSTVEPAVSANSSAASHAVSAALQAHVVVAGSMREAHLRGPIAQPIAEENDSDEELDRNRTGLRGRGSSSRHEESDDDDRDDDSDDEGVALGASGIRREAGTGGPRKNRLPSDSRDDGGIFESDI